MSVQVLVVDAYDKPVANVEVFVKWTDGLSTVRTDSSGIADTGTNGSITYISVNGKETKYYDTRYENTTLRVKI